MRRAAPLPALLLLAGCYSPSTPIPPEGTPPGQSGRAAGGQGGHTVDQPQVPAVPGPGAQRGPGRDSQNTAAGTAPSLDPPGAPEDVPVLEERSRPMP